ELTHYNRAGARDDGGTQESTYSYDFPNAVHSENVGTSPLPKADRGRRRSHVRGFRASTVGLPGQLCRSNPRDSRGSLRLSEARPENRLDDRIHHRNDGSALIGSEKARIRTGF